MTGYTDALRRACFEAMPVIRFGDRRWPLAQNREAIETRARQIMMEAAENLATENDS